MILAVDIIGDRAPDCNGGRAWDDRKKPTGGHRQLKDVCQQDTGLARNKARVAIEGMKRSSERVSSSAPPGLRQLSP